MSLIELARQVSDLSEARQDLAGLALDDIDPRVVLVDHEHEGLGGIARQCERHRRASALLDLPIGRHGDGLPRIVEGLLEIPHLVVEPYLVAITVADVNRPVIGDFHAVNGVHAFDPPLAQEISIRIQHHDAAVAVSALAVGDVDVAVLPIDMNTGRRGEAGRIRVQWSALGGAIGGIEHALLADLLQEPAAVMGIFLDHAARRARDPHVAIFVELAGVKAERRWTVAQPRDSSLDQVWITPGMDHLAGGIELDHQRRQTPGIQFTVQHVLAIEKENVVLRIDAMSAEPPRNPSIRKRLREGDIDLVARRGTLRPTGGHPKTRGHDRRYGGDTYSDDAAHFMEVPSPNHSRLVGPSPTRRSSTPAAAYWVTAAAMARRLVGHLLWRPRVRPCDRHSPNVSDDWTYVWPSDPRRPIGCYPLDRRADRAPVIFNSTGVGHRPKTYSIDAVEVCLSSGAWGMMLFGCREPASTATYCLPFTA